MKIYHNVQIEPGAPIWLIAVIGIVAVVVFGYVAVLISQDERKK